MALATTWDKRHSSSLPRAGGWGGGEVSVQGDSVERHRQ